MIRNKKLLETLYECVKRNGECKGCFYGDGTEAPSCMFHLMNDVLFFFNNPVPSKDAHVLSLEELEEALSDRKDHLAFAEFISSIHVAKPVIRSVQMSQNVITLYDPNTNEKDQFLKSDYYTSFRVWSAKPTDKLRNDTEWIPLDGHLYDEQTDEKTSKTTDILRFAHNRLQNTGN